MMNICFLDRLKRLSMVEATNLLFFLSKTTLGYYFWGVVAYL